MSYQFLSALTEVLRKTLRTGTPVHILDNDSLLIIFLFCRPVILDKSEVDNDQFLEGGKWNREHWWYNLAQVCRRWRCLVLESAFHLRLSLVCARGTPVADLLAHSPPFPLIIDHVYLDDGITAEDEKGIILALQHRDRVRRIRIRKAAPILKKLIRSLEGEFPILEYLYVMPQKYQRPVLGNKPRLNVPKTFRAPHLRQLLLMGFAIPIRSPSLTTMGNLVTLSLSSIPRSAYFHPNALLERVVLMPQLVALGIFFNSYNPSGNIQRQLLRTPITTRVTLPDLRALGFQGASAYLEALLPWVTIPLLDTLQVYFFNQPTYPIPHLQQFMSTARNLRLKTATLTFREDYLYVTAYPRKESKMYTLSMMLGDRHLNQQVASAIQVFRTLRTVLAAVEYLTLKCSNSRPFMSLVWNNQADRTQWRELFRTFSNVKTLCVGGRLVEQLSRALQPGEGESPTELLPDLQELSYFAKGDSSNAFAQFSESRQQAGQPVTVIHL